MKRLKNYTKIISNNFDRFKMYYLNSPFQKLLSSRNFDSFVFDSTHSELVNFVAAATHAASASFDILEIKIKERLNRMLFEI